MGYKKCVKCIPPCTHARNVVQIRAFISNSILSKIISFWAQFYSKSIQEFDKKIEFDMEM